jgi:ArsR family transcriptional regulator
MQNHGILARRKEGVKILYAVKHPEVFQIVDLAAGIYGQETRHRTRTLKKR